jgi:hypothetical protein
METKENCCEKDNENCCENDKGSCCNGHNWSIWRCISIGIMGVIGFTLFAFLFGYVIMWLWNCLVPQIFHLAIITYWQAVGLAVLARLIFGGFRQGENHPFHHGHNFANHHHGHDFANHHHDFKNHNHSKEECNCTDDKWKHYDQFWHEEGEKAFEDYIKRKSENQ